MTEKELLKYVLDRAPTLRILLEKYGHNSVWNYAQEKYLHPQESQKKIEFLDFLTKYVSQRHSPEIAHLVTKSLEKNYAVSTADHHGPIGHPFWFQGTILRGFTSPDNTIINFCTSHVSLGNSSYPRGFVVQSDTQKIPHLQLPLFSATERMSPVFGYNNFSEKNIFGNFFPQLDKHKKNKHISNQKYDSIKNWAQEILLSEKILSQESYSEQVTLINFSLWNRICGNKMPDLIAIDGEEIVSEILIQHLEKNIGLSPLLTQIDIQPVIEEKFDGISCCFTRKTLNGTYLFWYLDSAKKRHALWRENKMLVGNNGSVKIEMTPEKLSCELRAKKLIPSGLLTYATLAGYYEIQCFGGFSQGSYLPKLLSAYSEIAQIQKSENESILCENIVFSMTKQGAITTALDMLSDPLVSNHEKLLLEAKNTTMLASISTMLPEIARCLPR